MITSSQLSVCSGTRVVCASGFVRSKKTVSNSFSSSSQRAPSESSRSSVASQFRFPNTAFDCTS